MQPENWPSLHLECISFSFRNIWPEEKAIWSSCLHDKQMPYHGRKWSGLPLIHRAIKWEKCSVFLCQNRYIFKLSDPMKNIPSVKRITTRTVFLVVFFCCTIFSIFRVHNARKLSIPPPTNKFPLEMPHVWSW